MATQAELALNMIQQLRLLDPSVSAEIGSPERKIIDTVAQELANAQVDLAQLDGAFDLESKFGTDLDNFLSVFGFARQSGSQATGFVTFGRVVPSLYKIPIPQGTQIAATAGGAINLVTVLFATTAFGEIPSGETSVTVPIRCLTTGTIGNVAANTINSWARTPVIGVTEVTNPIATSGGTDVETDAALKVRFKNTVFRNLAGTLDQYLALAVSTAFTSKANAVGPISRYQEYIQVPNVDDATADGEFLESPTGNGASGEWTSALSSIPYSKHIYSELPYYLTSGDTNSTAIFYKEEVDFQINTSVVARDRGDTYRGHFGANVGPDPNTDATTEFQPNLTFFNVYKGEEAKVIALRPGDIVLFEHAYMSDVSRNEYSRQLLNCVDVFINGQNPTQADAMTVKPNVAFASANQFVTNTTSRYYFENFRRIGHPEQRPVPGNFFQGLFWTPVLSLPETIVTSKGTYKNGIHYWAVEDVSNLGRSVRARTGIEWNPTVFGEAEGDKNEEYTGFAIVVDSGHTGIEIEGYTYDKNIVDLQASLEANKQITTDVLAHQSKTRYFKLDLTIMYMQGATIANVNNQIQVALESFFEGAYFGTTIQLSDILQVVHNVSGVDNVRWSRDLIGDPDDFPLDVDASGNPRYRVVECDQEGYPLCNFILDRRTYGSASTTEVQIGYLAGLPTSGSFALTAGGLGASVTAAIPYNASAAEVKAAINAKVEGLLATVTGTGTALDPFVLTYASKKYHELLKTTNNLLRGSTLVGETTVFDSDFFLKDDELPSLPTGMITGDTLPGLILRKRVQNTWALLAGPG